MLVQKLAGMKVVTVFDYRGAKIYIRGRSRYYEQLIIYKGQLYTHYFESPPETRGRVLSQEEEMNMVQTIMDISRATVDDIVSQRSLTGKLTSFIHVIQSKAADLFAEWKGEDGKRLEAETGRPFIEVPEEASRHEA